MGFSLVLLGASDRIESLSPNLLAGGLAPLCSYGYN